MLYNRFINNETLEILEFPKSYYKTIGECILEIAEWGNPKEWEYKGCHEIEVK
jgi:hypothetical protein